MSALEFRVSIAQLGGGRAHVVSLSGDCDLYNAPQLSGRLDAVVHGAGGRVVVDLQSASFIDSTALGILLRCYRELRVSGRELVLVIDTPGIMRIFEITGLDRLFRIERSLLAAVGPRAERTSPSQELPLDAA